MTKMLDAELLTALEDAWREQGAEIAGCLASGLDAAEMHALLEPLGIELPDEAALWWGWHNGVTSTTVRGWDIGPDVGFYSLEQAIDRYRRQVQLSEIGAWPPRWLPLTDFRRGPLTIDCDVAQHEPVPVYAADWEIGNFSAFPSMGDLVTHWLEAIACGAWRWNPSGGYWDRDASRMPEEMHWLI